MADSVPGPTGLGRRARRLSDGETADRMLSAALEMINRTGLTVSLDHLSLEDVIREAGVARSAVYRHWPYKDLFFSDVVAELAKAAIPTAAANDAIAGLIRGIVAERAGDLASPEGRHGLLVEVIRQAALADFDALYGSAQWRTYLALHATFLSLGDGELRDRVQETLRRSEQGFVDRVAASWQHVAGLFGYRLRPGYGTSFATVATVASAALRGLILMGLSTPDIAERRTAARPFGATRQAEWSVPALGLAGIASSFLEPDPDVTWDAERSGAVLRAMASLTVPTP
ncbi:TetR/AcrR family transcriptional regulator [Amycolatopsis sp. NPDC004747]